MNKKIMIMMMTKMRGLLLPCSPFLQGWTVHLVIPVSGHTEFLRHSSVQTLALLAAADRGNRKQQQQQQQQQPRSNTKRTPTHFRSLSVAGKKQETENKPGE
jgi:hypothetical protein